MLSRFVLTGCSILAAAGMIIASVCYFRASPVVSEVLLEEARLALARGRHGQAEALARQAAAAKEPSPWAFIVAAEATLKANRYADALECYRQAPRSSAAVASSADFGEAEMLCHLGRLSESEAKLHQLLAREPLHNLAHYRLAFLLNITGRRWEAQPHLLHLVRNSAATIEHLLLLGNSLRQVEDRELLGITATAFPDDPLPKLGSARLALTLNRTDEAFPLLKSVLANRPNEPEAVVGMGQILLDDADPNLFISWSTKLSSEIERHPEVWMLRGQFAQRNKQTQIASRCFWEALRRDPEHQGACHQLGRSLTDQNDVDHAIPFLRRAELLQRLSAALDDLFHHRDHVESMRRAALLTRELGRLWEAASWSSIALSNDPRLPWAVEILQEISPRLHPDLPQTFPDDNPSRTLDLTSFPLPRWSLPDQPAESTPQPNAISKQIQFTDSARKLGIDFLYENAADDATPGARIFETTGGGVGVIDYDLDGWPDLYLTQGGTDPNTKTRTATDASDRLFRNDSGHLFVDVTIPSLLGDQDFSQGVAVGDFDNDGFPDLYVANLGQNRLYRNHGDGTFEDITRESGLRETQWTTSCLMADLNGDAFPDLYDVNYAGGESVLTRICEKQGVVRSCSPRAFDSAIDCVWHNQIDGHVRNVTAQWGADVPNGYGLGIVAMDLEGEGRLSLFVANDEVPNFLLVNRSRGSQSFRFDERALEAGVALDANGRAQACMGVASGDADGDGLIDLLVTNFYHESSTLYRQIVPGQFEDLTRTSGLRDPSFAMLGFGTQFLDADLDGWEDLVVTNGHIDDLTSIGEPYKMRTQFFSNIGQGRFVEVAPVTLGSFFEQTHLGRGLARLDWNRDGLDDFAVSHLREPMSLLTNETSDAGHYLSVQLRGTRCSRDAIGTTAQITTGNRRFVKQLTAGDGYHASNERQLRFGLGPFNQVDELTIRWPNGESQTWTKIAADQTILIIERSARWLTISVSP